MKNGNKDRLRPVLFVDIGEHMFCTIIWTVYNLLDSTIYWTLYHFNTLA